MRTDVLGALRNLLRVIRDKSFRWGDVAPGFTENGREMTFTEAVDELIRLLSTGHRYLPDSRRLSGLGREPPWKYLDPGITDLVRLLWDEGFTTTDSGDGVSKCDEGRVFDRPHVAITVDKHDLLVETDRAIAVLEASGRPIDPLTAWHVEGTYAGGDDALIMVWGPEP